MKFGGLLVLCPRMSPLASPLVFVPLADDCAFCGGSLDGHELRILTVDGELVDARERECNAT